MEPALSVAGAEGRTYPFFAGRGLLADVLPRFLAENGARRVAIVTNDVVDPLYGEALCDRLPGSFVIVLPDGERYKTLDSVRLIYDALLERGADRATVLVALGGGVVGDTAGFAAASFMRGVRLVQAPTTLLAMVDASVGGKTGVDLPQGKNLVGAFKDPLAVFADLSTLDTLSEVEFRAGMAEVIKAGLVGDANLFDALEGGAPPIEEQITRAVAVKAAIVEQDRLESGPRAYLNLGHTFAHAIEQASGYRWRHGLAVGVGLAAAARLSERLGLCEDGLTTRVERTLAKHGLPARYADLRATGLWEAMQRDKKWQNGQARFVLLEGVGRPTLRADVPPRAVFDVLAELRED